MYAQLVEGGTTPELRDRMDRIVREELLPALAVEPGFAGTLNLVDRETGKAMMLMLWETREQWQQWFDTSVRPHLPPGAPDGSQFVVSRGKPGIGLVRAPVGLIANHLLLMPWPLMSPGLLSAMK